MVEIKEVKKANTLNRKSHVDMNHNQVLNFVFQHYDDTLDIQAVEGVPGQALFWQDSLWVCTSRGWIDVLVGRDVGTEAVKVAIASFDEPTTVWEIEPDNLNQLALVECISSEGQQINGDVHWGLAGGNARVLSASNRITVTFSEAVSGTAVFIEDKDSGYETVYEFSEPSGKWVIEHGLGDLVAVQCVDSNGQKIRGTTHWDLENKNSVTINFSKKQTGWAVIAGGDPDTPTIVREFTDSAEWVIEHGLGRYCEVQLMDMNGKALRGDIVWTDLNTVTVTFSQKLSGRAIIV